MSTSDTLALIQVIAAFASIGIDILLAVIGFKIDRRNKQMNERSQADHVENVSQAIPPEIPRVDVPKDSNTIKKIDFAFKRIRKDATNNRITVREFINHLNKLFTEKTIVQTLMLSKEMKMISWNGPLSVETVIEVSDWDRIIDAFHRCPRR